MAFISYHPALASVLTNCYQARQHSWHWSVMEALGGQLEVVRLMV